MSAPRTSKSRNPDFVIRCTTQVDEASSSSTADDTAAGSVLCGTCTVHAEAVSTSVHATRSDSTTSSTSMPVGISALRASFTFSGSHTSHSAISRYSASLAAPVGDALA